MTLLLGRFGFAIAAVGLSIAALSPSPAEAGVMHHSLNLAAASGDSDVERVRCDRRLSNLWSCNDDPAIRDRRDERVQDRRAPSSNRYAAHPCDHS